MSTPKADRPLLELGSVDAWHAWLAANHATSDGAWLALAKKHSGAAAPTYEEAVEEALCWGWIDTTARRLDEARYLGLFTPRKPDGTWARSNKERVERLIAEGRMQAAGQAVIDAARASGAWTLLEEVEAHLIPDDLSAALAADPRAVAGFESLAGSAKEMALYWIATAKRAETRARRIEATVLAAAEGRGPR